MGFSRRRRPFPAAGVRLVIEGGKVQAVPDVIDTDCVALVAAVNRLPGVHTTSSCCGHGQDPYRIFLRADSFQALRALTYWLRTCHCGRAGWSLVVETDCSMSPVGFIIEAGIVNPWRGEPRAYEEIREGAESIALLLDRWMDSRPRWRRRLDAVGARLLWLAPLTNRPHHE